MLPCETERAGAAAPQRSGSGAGAEPSGLRSSEAAVSALARERRVPTAEGAKGAEEGFLRGAALRGRSCKGEGPSRGACDARTRCDPLAGAPFHVLWDKSMQGKGDWRSLGP